MSFDILKHRQKLKIETELATEYRCICPICEGNNLTINKESGAYNCWSGCEVADIRNAIAPLPRPKSTRPKSDRTWVYLDAKGNSIIRTRRFDNGEGERKIWQEYCINGRWQAKSSPKTKAARAAAKKAVMPYNYLAAMEDVAKGETVLWVEGEPCVDALRNIGITAVTTIGGCGSYKKYGDYSQLFQGAKLVICPDCDQTGLKYARDIAKDHPDAQWLYPFSGQPCWNNPSKDGGRDIADWIAVMKADGKPSEEIREIVLNSTGEQVLETVKMEVSQASPIVFQAEESEIFIPDGGVDIAAKQVLNRLSKEESDSGKIYVRGNSNSASLARIIAPVPDARSRYISIPKDLDTIQTLDRASLLFELNSRFKFTTFRGKNLRSIDCPQSLAQHILSADRWPELPKLTGIIAHPMPTLTGEVINNPGYHPGSGLLLSFDPKDFDPPIENPAREDALNALGLLKHLLREFCFKVNPEVVDDHGPETNIRNVSLSAAIAMIVTAVWRKTLPQAPLFAITATEAGTGKGCLSRCAETLVTGQNSTTRVAYSGDAQEVRKSLLPLLSSGVPVLSLDNINTKLGGAALESVLTEPFYEDRILGESRTLRVSTQVLFIANGNNLGYTRDMARRTVQSELDAGQENPEQREFEDDPVKMILENRSDFLNACITIVRAYLHAGSPDKAKPLGSYREWSDLIRSALIWLGEFDPVLSQQNVAKRDETYEILGSLLWHWYDALPHENNTRATIPKTTKDVVNAARSLGFDELHSALGDVCTDGKTGGLSSRMLSYYLRRHQGRVVDGLRFKSKGSDRTRMTLWAVEDVDLKKASPNAAGLSSASSALNPVTHFQQEIEVAEDKKASSAITPAPQSIRKEVTAGSSLPAEDKKVSSAYINTCSERDAEISAEDAEDKSALPEVVKFPDSEVIDLEEC